MRRFTDVRTRANNRGGDKTTSGSVEPTKSDQDNSDYRSVLHGLPAECEGLIRFESPDNSRSLAEIIGQLRQTNDGDIVVLCDFNKLKVDSAEQLQFRPIQAAEKQPRRDDCAASGDDLQSDTMEQVNSECGLTSRELEVLKLLVLGKCNKEVAKDLSISHRTVEAHRQSIRRKTGRDRLSSLIEFARMLEL